MELKRYVQKRGFSLIDIPASHEKLDNTDDLTRILGFLGKEATGKEVNSAIPDISIYPELNPTDIKHFVNKEDQFWIMAEECTVLGLKQLKDGIGAAAIYEPIYKPYPTKHYLYVFRNVKIEEVIRTILMKTDAPVMIADDNEDEINPTLLKLMEIRYGRDKFRFFTPDLSEIELLKLDRNLEKVRIHMEKIWIPRYKNGIIKGIFLANADSCVFCGKIDDIIVNGTIFDYGLPIAVLYGICKKCFTGMKEKTISEKLIKMLSKENPEFKEYKFRYPTTLEYFELIQKDLENRQIKMARDSEIKKNGSELHLFFQNNYTLVISYRDMLSYAYVLVKEGDEILKWDSRDDHNVDTGKDHFHHKKKNYNADVENSYLIGNFFADFDFIYEKIKQYIEN